MSATSRFSRPLRWLAPAALFALGPKCFLCLAAYVGLGTALIGGPELCGGSTGWMESSTSRLVLIGAAASVLIFFSARRCYRRFRSRSASSEA